MPFEDANDTERGVSQVLEVHPLHGATCTDSSSGPSMCAFRGNEEC